MPAARAKKASKRRAGTRRPAKKKTVAKKTHPSLVKKKCPECKQEVATKFLDRHMRTKHGAPVSPGEKAATDEAISKRHVTQAVERYLELLDSGEPVGTEPVVVNVAGGHNYGKTSNLDKIDEALGKLDVELAAATKPGRRMKLIQRILTIRAGADRLRMNGHGPQSQFILYGAEYAAEKGYTYEAFEFYGVPKKVLDAAGIQPSSA